MNTVFIENGSNTQKIYDSLLVEPEGLAIFNSELALKIIKELSRQPACAMDLARHFDEQEQKIYYHLRKMIKAGIVKLEKSEARYGMTAKIYAVVSPVIAAKLNESGYITDSNVHVIDSEVEKFLQPFIVNGKLNATIIVGAPAQHGTYEATARDGIHTIDLALFLGKYAQHVRDINYKMDVEVNEHEDLKDNLILIGNSKINMIVNKINDQLPIFFDQKNAWAITSKLTGKTYNYDDNAVIIKLKNPFNKKKEILILAGMRSRGLRSAVFACTKYTHEIMKGNIENEEIIAKVVQGIDKNGDGIIDSVTFLE